MIVEPIQGEGGDNHFRPEFIKELRRLADKHEFLLIFDEVQCGYGTTGKWWSFEHTGVFPDVFVFGKKTQFVVLLLHLELMMLIMFSKSVLVLIVLGVVLLLI